MKTKERLSALTRGRESCGAPVPLRRRGGGVKRGDRFGFASSHAGFTLTEMMFSVGLFTLIMASAMAAFSMAGRRAQTGTQQVLFNTMARVAQQRVMRYVESGKTVALEGGQVAITTIDFRTSAIVFEDGDENPNTRVDNELVYYSDIDDPATRTVISTHVGPIGTNEMFRILPSSPTSVQLTFHIGQSAVELAAMGADRANPGVDVRISASPRNRQRWYD